MYTFIKCNRDFDKVRALRGTHRIQYELNLEHGWDQTFFEKKNSWYFIKRMMLNKRKHGQ